MSETAQEEIQQLEKLIKTHTGRLRILERQIATYGSSAVPAHIELDYHETAENLQRARAELRRLRPLVDERSPYIGLNTFQEQNADLFFGRETLVDQLVDKVQAGPFLAVLGPSGSGKSSVVLAGLIPMLKGGALPGSETWRYIILKPGLRPLDTLAAELAKLQGDPTAVVRYRETLNASERALLLLAETLLDRAAGQRLVLVVDQFEELWTLAPAEGEARTMFLAEQQRPFVRLLLTAVNVPDTPLLTVLTMRADFLHRAADDPTLAHAIGEHDVIVSPMTPAELRDAIVRPADLVGGGFEPGLVEELIKQVQDRSGALPLLEYTLEALWREKTAEGLMTWEALRTLGGIEGALAARADAIVERCYTPEQREELRHLLVRLVQPGEGAVDTRRRTPLDDLVPAGSSAETVYRLLKPLADERLITTDHDITTGEETVEVSHEALIRAWPKFSSWISEERADLRILLQLEEDAKEWRSNNHNPGFLWNEARLASIAPWLERTKSRLNERDQAFLEASSAAIEAKRQQEQQRQLDLARAQERAEKQQQLADLERQRADEQVRAKGRLRRLATMLAVAVIVAIGLAYYAFHKRTQFEQQDRLTKVVLQTLTRLEAQPDLRLLLMSEVSQRDESPEARGGLLSVLESNTHLRQFLRGHSDTVYSTAWSPDGRLVASSSADGTIMLWDAATGKPAGAPLLGHTAAVLSIGFSPDSRILASGSTDATIMLWDTAARKPLGPPLIGHTSKITRVTFSPDGRMLASSDAEGLVILWDAATRKPLGPPLLAQIDSAGKQEVGGLAFSPNGKLLATAGQDNYIILWDVQTRQPVGAPMYHDAWVRSVAFSPDGRLLASAGGAPGHPDKRDNRIIVWDAATHARLYTIGEHTNTVLSLAFSPDGKLLASGGMDNRIVLWDLAAQRVLGRPFQGHAGDVWGLAFSPDSAMLASASGDKSIALWNIAETSQIGQQVASHNSLVRSVAFSPDSAILATGNDNKNIAWWSVATHEQFGETPPRGIHQHGVTSVAWSPDGKSLAEGSIDGKMIVWDTATYQHIRSLEQDSFEVYSVVFSPDGATLAAGGCLLNQQGNCRAPSPIVFWNISTGTYITRTTDFNIIRSLAFSPDGKLLAVGGNGILLWDVAGQQPLGEPLKGHQGDVHSVAFSPDGTLLASGGNDNNVIVWDMASRTPTGGPLVGHTGTVNSVAFSPDGKLLASGSADQFVILWDAASRKPLGEPLAGHTNSVNSVAFSPDGKLLASGSDDQTFMLWEVSVEAWRDRACQIAARNITTDEWNQYLAGETPRLTCPAMLFHPELIQAGRSQAKQGQQAEALAQFQQARDLNAALELDPTAEAQRFTAIGLLARAREQARSGNLAEALDLFQQAGQQNPGLGIAPQSEVDRFAGQSLLAQARERANDGQVDEAVALFERARQTLTSWSIDPRQEAHRFATPAYIRLAANTARDGDIEAAIGSYRLVRPIDPAAAAAVSLVTWNRLCFFGTLRGYAADVIDACEWALVLTPDESKGPKLDNRGRARVLIAATLAADAPAQAYLHDTRIAATWLSAYQSAIEDFRQYIVWAKRNGYTQCVPSRESWIQALEAGQNPFNQKTRDAVLNDPTC